MWRAGESGVGELVKEVCDMLVRAVYSVFGINWSFSPSYLSTKRNILIL